MKYTITGANVIALLQQADLFVGQQGDFSSLCFSSVCYNSKEALPGGLFVCKGIHFNEAYLHDALQKGSLAYVSERPYPSSAPCVITTNIRRALALIARAFYRYEKDAFTLIGVTGTKGKSTTVYYISSILTAAHQRRPAYLTTVDIFDGKNSFEATLTTPESLKGYEYFARARENGVKEIVMELSSQSDKMDRLVGMHFHYGVFVNISEDHIAPDEHKDFDEYFTCKKNIVARFSNAVINFDDCRAGEVLSAAKNAERVLTYSLDEHSGADIYAKNIRPDGFKTQFRVVTPTWEEDMEIIIPGVFNVSNALGAIGVAYLMGLSKEACKTGVRETHVQGRMNIFEKNGHIAIVDYAHNKDSIRHAFEALKTYYPERKIKVLFGCPGDKAYGRRKDMSEMSVRYADYIYISSEDPDYKDPLSIAKEVEGYILKLGGRCEIETDRKTCVIKAIRELKTDEILLIAGKGSEHYQVVRGIAEPYEGDTVLAKTYIEQLK